MSRILLVDDSKFMKEVLSDILKESHQVVGQADSGTEAVRSYLSLKPDVVLMDIVMPEMDGIAAVREIRKKDPKAKVIMVTSLGHDIKVKEALSAGAMGYIVKPFKAPDVLKEIEVVLEKDEEDVESLTIDTLKELSNIAAGHLSNVISPLAKEDMEISVPEEEIVTVSSASDRISVLGKTMVVGIVKVGGDVKGSLIVIVPKKGAERLANVAQDTVVDPLLFPTGTDKETLKELMGLSSVSYLRTMVEYLGAHLVPANPEISVDENFNLVNFVNFKKELKKEFEGEEVILVSIGYSIKNASFKGEILMVLGPNILDYLKQKIRERFEKKAKKK